MPITLTLTAEEHFALTAVLRSSLSRGALLSLDLSDLEKRLSAPYRAELEAKFLPEHQCAMRMPALHSCPTLQAEQCALATHRAMPADFKFLKEE